jgi:hypothetical protein
VLVKINARKIFLIIGTFPSLKLFRIFLLV